MLACFGLASLVVKPLWNAARFFFSPGKVERVKKYRTAVSAVAFGILIAGAIFVPLPHRVQCTLYVKPREAAPVYVETAGQLRQIHAQPGDWVDKDQPIVSLANVDVQVAIERLKGERQRIESKLNSLRQRAFDDEGAGMEIGEVEESLASVDEQIASRERDIQKLIIVAPASGVVIPPPSIPSEDKQHGKLPTWSGTPFEARNLLAHLPEASPVCQIGDPNRLEAILAIDESDVEFLHPGQTVDVFLAQLPGQSFRSRIEQLSQVDMKIAPRNLSSKTGGDLVSRTDRSGLDRPLNTTYQANAFLDDEAGSLLIGATGQGKIYARPQTVAQRIWRYVSQTFNFDV
jgi:putative peptide zinc metalloprotease protein